MHASELWPGKQLFPRPALGRARGPGSLAVVNYVGYKAPQGLWQASHGSYADAGAPQLRSFQDGLRATHQGAPSHDTVIGHSYGSTVTGFASRDGAAGGLDADDMIVVGSPGIGVDHAWQLSTPPDHVYAGRSAADPVPYTNVHGAAPSSVDFGAQVLPTDQTGGHSSYFDANSPSLRAMAQIATGTYR